MFPPIVEYEEGLTASGEPVFPNVARYVLWIRDTYIKSTPFTYQDVREIHDELQDLRPGRYYYKWESIRSYLWMWRKEGLIEVLDGYDKNPGNHTLMWAAYYKRQIAKVQRKSKSTPSITEKFAQQLESVLEKHFDGE